MTKADLFKPVAVRCVQLAFTGEITENTFNKQILTTK